MIRTQEMVPDVYIEKSRDFQVLCRLYDFAFNSLKYNIDSMQYVTDTRGVKDTILPLLGDKFGIYDKESYSNRQLLEAFPIALKHKGSLKSVSILLNAFLDSLDTFTPAVALHSKDEESAKEISNILNREVKPYSLVIILSTFPGLTNLHILDEYLARVIPTGFIVEYMFGTSSVIYEKFKYKEYTFMYYTQLNNYGTDESPNILPYISMVAHRGNGTSSDKPDKYKVAFEYTGEDNLRFYTETVIDKDTWQPVHEIFDTFVNHILDDGTKERKLISDIEDGWTVEYRYNATKEFIDSTVSDIDVNAVGLATIGGEVQDNE